jgi:hypothetical protein
MLTRVSLKGDFNGQADISGSFTMTWDQVCGDFEAISLNWDPALYPNTAIRHWWVIPARVAGGQSDKQVVVEEGR